MPRALRSGRAPDFCGRNRYAGPSQPKTLGPQAPVGSGQLPFQFSKGPKFVLRGPTGAKSSPRCTQTVPYPLMAHGRVWPGPGGWLHGSITNTCPGVCYATRTKGAPCASGWPQGMWGPGGGPADMVWDTVPDRSGPLKSQGKEPTRARGTGGLKGTGNGPNGPEKGNPPPPPPGMAPLPDQSCAPLLHHPTPSTPSDPSCIFPPSADALYPA